MSIHGSQPVRHAASTRLLRVCGLLLLLIMITGAGSISNLHAEADTLQWTKLPNLPDREGFAAMFAGVQDGTLIVAGGANFPDKRPWEGGTKIWYDIVFALEQPGGTWKNIGKLPRPLGYGVTVSTKDGLICVGGSDASGHHADVFKLSWAEGSLTTAPLPSLPKPCANMCGALLGNTIYVAGGIETPTATTALKNFWALDLNNLKAGWRELAPWPGPARMLATAGVQDGSFFSSAGQD